MLERVLERENLLAALKRVEANGGAPGIDGMTVEELRPYLKEHWLEIRASLEAGVYQPRAVRRDLATQWLRINGGYIHVKGVHPSL